MHIEYVVVVATDSERQGRRSRERIGNYHIRTVGTGEVYSTGKVSFPG